ncbi:MAG: 3-phosphoshikimate 1-carboxyvinyltransferase [Acidimicrobiia bacterium]
MGLGQPPEPGRAVIVGTGLIGGSIGMRLRRLGWYVTGRDASPAVAERALELRALDAIGDDPEATVTFVATPVHAIAAEARHALGRSRGPVTDVGGVKASIVDDVSDPRFVGGHPMAGSEQEGVEGATDDLFEGATWVLTPTAGTDAAAYAQVRQIVTSLGAEVVALPPERHDALVAVVSHVPHLTAASLMRLADERSEEHRALLRLAAGGFRDMTRIASGHPGIWPDICSENRAAIVDVLDDLTGALAEMRAIVERDDRDALLAALTSARAARVNLPARFRTAADLRELRIPVPDRPGVLAEVTTLATDLDVNITDLEIAHSTEGDRGVLILLVESSAVDLLRRGLAEHGFRPSVHTVDAAASPAVRPVEPIGHPIEATVAVPGSKSLTNRALVCAALADGTSVIEGALFADDTEAMSGALRSLGAVIDADASTRRLTVAGTAGALRPGPIDLDVRMSGTTSRFLLPLVALGEGPYRLDGAPSLRARPMGPVLAAVRGLGARVEERGAAGHLPVTVIAPGGLAGGRVVVPGDISSQFVSGLLLAAPYLRGGAEIVVGTPLVSRPYVDMTLATMAACGVEVTREADPATGALVLRVPEAVYRAVGHAIEPDASTASYFLAAAALCGGRVTVAGLGRGSLQGDARLADLLADMGAHLERDDTSTTVTGTGKLRTRGDVDLADMPDMAPTLAVLAPFADGPTRVRGVGFIRGHETDRIAAIVRELRRCGIEADAEDDGFVVHPGTPRPARIETYDDHRMAMSFAVMGLRAPGIEIADPACVGKTFPGFWDALESLRG